jgi:aspartyl-tRNA(Asn)/glutamyl-tRNA(Gln) amidotransferase subunit C
VAVTPDDVRSIAQLARLAVPPERVHALVQELNGILAHMDALARVQGSDAAATAEAAAPGMTLAPDAGPSVPLERAPQTFAPSWRSEFFLVPLLATHGAAGSTARSTAGSAAAADEDDDS